MPAASTCSCSTRRTCTRATAVPTPAADGQDFADNALALRRAGARRGGHRARAPCADFVPDVVHAHDWQAGLAPAYLHYAGGPRPRTVMTVHNLAFQGQFPA